MSAPWSWDPATVAEQFNDSVKMLKDHPKLKNGPSDVAFKARPTIPPSTIKTVGPATVRAPLAETSANTAPKAAPAGGASKKAPASRKRKSDTQDAPTLVPAPPPEISDADPRLRIMTDNCDQVRKKIRSFLESGGMKVGEFQNAIGVSAGAYSRFMGQNGAFKGEGCATFDNAFVFFKKRELQGLPLKGANVATSAPVAKKVKKNEEEKGGALNVDGIQLEDEDIGEVEIYDTCDEVRKKLRAYLRKDGVTQAALLRALAAGLHDGKKITSGQLNGFLSKKGPVDGNRSIVFYAGYVFFEKIRIKQGKPKTTMREEMEEVWGTPHRRTNKCGVDRVTDYTKGFICHKDSVLTYDKYGKLHSFRR